MKTHGEHELERTLYGQNESQNHFSYSPYSQRSSVQEAYSYLWDTFYTWRETDSDMSKDDPI